MNLPGVWLGTPPLGLILMPMTSAESRGHYLGADLALAASHVGHLLQNPGVKPLTRISS